MRLTEKKENGFYELTKNNEIYGEENGIRLVQIVGQLEDIEEEFQIDNFDDLRERLKTYKFLANHEMSCVDVDGYNCMLKDLKEYHDIEKELGISLIILSKILKNGCYVKPWKAVLFSKVMTLKTTDFGELKLFDNWDNDYSLCDYGVDFALTKEKLL